MFTHVHVVVFDDDDDDDDDDDIDNVCGHHPATTSG